MKEVREMRKGEGAASKYEGNERIGKEEGNAGAGKRLLWLRDSHEIFIFHNFVPSTYSCPQKGYASCSSWRGIHRRCLGTGRIKTCDSGLVPKLEDVRIQHRRTAFVSCPGLCPHSTQQTRSLS